MASPTKAYPSVQTRYTRSLVYRLAAMGDSLTDNFDLGVEPDEFWPGRLGDLLRNAGCFVSTANYGRSGNTSANTSPNAMYRLPACLLDGAISLFILAVGVNDPGNGINTAASTANQQAMIKLVKFGGRGYVAGQANLPAGGSEGDRYVVLTDTSSTGGLAATQSWQATTLTGAGGSAQTVWEYRLGLAGESGWGRIATAATTPTHTTKIIVLSAPFLNFGGSYTAGTQKDTTATPYVTYDASTGVRKAQSDAAANESVVYGDFYSFLSQRITDAKDTAGSFSWHVADGNQHGNAYFHRLAAEYLYSLIAAQTGWIAALTA